MPPMMPRAMGARVSAPGPQPMAAGMAPATVAIDVIKIGRRRIGHAFKTACEDLGASKILFGSDSPYANPGAVKRMVEDSPLCAEDKALILGGNIARLLKLQ